MLAFLIAGQRREIVADTSKALPENWRKRALRLALLLRLAVLLNRSRKETEHPPVTMQVSGNKIEISFDAEWLAENPLTIADLEREQDFLEQLGYELHVA